MFTAALSSPAVLSTLWAMPARAMHQGFDALRGNYAAAVNAGLLERSQLANGRFEQWLASLEKATMGPLARQR